jgi:hypothetical protein
MDRGAADPDQRSQDASSPHRCVSYRKAWEPAASWAADGLRPATDSPTASSATGWYRASSVTPSASITADNAFVTTGRAIDDAISLDFAGGFPHRSVFARRGDTRSG